MINVFLFLSFFSHSIFHVGDVGEKRREEDFYVISEINSF